MEATGAWDLQNNVVLFSIQLNRSWCQDCLGYLPICLQFLVFSKEPCRGIQNQTAFCTGWKRAGNGQVGSKSPHHDSWDWRTNLHSSQPRHSWQASLTAGLTSVALAAGSGEGSGDLGRTAHTAQSLPVLIPPQLVPLSKITNEEINFVTQTHSVKSMSGKDN